MLIGVILLTIGLVRAGELPWWMPLLYAIGLVISFIPSPNPAVGVLLSLPWFVGAAAIATRLTPRTAPAAAIP